MMLLQVGNTVEEDEVRHDEGRDREPYEEENSKPDPPVHSCEHVRVPVQVSNRQNILVSRFAAPTESADKIGAKSSV